MMLGVRDTVLCRRVQARGSAVREGGSSEAAARAKLGRRNARHGGACVGYAGSGVTSSAMSPAHEDEELRLPQLGACPPPSPPCPVPPLRMKIKAKDRHGAVGRGRGQAGPPANLPE